MTNPIINRIQRPLRQRVLVRRASISPPPIDASADGWVEVPNLRCDQVSSEVGASVGHASFTLLVRPGDPIEVHQQLAGWSIDDQVRVEVWPLPDLADAEEDVEAQAIPLFEGTLSRPAFAITADATGASEQVTFTAIATPAVDNQLAEHLVRGRALPTLGQPNEPFIAESQSIPCVFNFRARRNMGSTLINTADGWQYRLFTVDEDPTGLAWTVREALRHLLGQWWYGPATNPLPRRVSLEIDTALAVCSGDLLSDERFAGLEDELPEVNVHGLGVLEALDVVAKAGGFRIACEPTGAPARLYEIKVRKRNSGDLVTLDLASRGSTYSSVENFLAANNVSTFRGFRDGAEVTNEVWASGRTFVEATWPLYPLWDEVDLPAVPINDDLQDSPDQDMLESHPYFSRHVQGAKLFDTYGHVGRAWGIDCLGGGETGYGSAFYADGDYAQPSTGFDFADFLNLYVTGNPVETWRTAANVTDPLRWSRRVRSFSELRSSQARAAMRPFLLEVSQDSGTTWNKMLTVSFSVLPRACGIMLSIDNLALVDSALLNSRTDRDIPDPDKSWWGLMVAQTLRLRLSACVEADHAIRFNAKRQNTSASLHRRAMLMPLATEELLVAPNSAYNTGSSWLRYADANTPYSSDATRDIAKPAQRRRDALEDAQISAVASLVVMDLKRYHLLDRVTKLAGREWSLAVNAGQAKSYPAIAGITYQLGERQGIDLQLEDQRQTKGANPWQS